MHKVLGFGGFFFRSNDPSKLATWYAEHLGIDPVPQDYDTPGWRQSGGTTVFAPFAADSDYFGDAAKNWMVNFRVSDLEAIVAQLRGAGIDVTVNDEAEPNGRFARLHDPEGNPIELWEPAGGAAETEEVSK